ncbi:adaptin ear-binding coat-associated protein 2 [Capsaspora owczarzaki ATCC 30864]|uniref:Adaptin ear-binding coat-associated protein 2 n=1 Tax=Capsaspora owczarzaki (strain ATCC 30864) TaxID=595528 RepID=A0A0D2WJC2_CAPO3|nr:adaptin ear-binding coat-associated protein 2 [Capsaspora owczarzaki ATCC 30864]KJE89453.1 adaptin ear-binding coat-associated protein 2 [Capsaspora owczarzaki ATCC 30864]|eukprot:XP_004365788.1 adaptin ear-binding coat-associated protein 2 [Capsaspora owczarzaki ATCC 30864]
MEFETTVMQKQECFVYRLPPRPSNRGFRAADWDLEHPIWSGRIKVVTQGDTITIKLEDKSTGELFAPCPVDAFPGTAVEAVIDSSRYFVLRIVDPSGRHAFIGLGFADRGDSFDLQVALQDHFKFLHSSREIEKQAAMAKANPQPSLDLGFKAGEKLHINFGKKTGIEAGHASSASANSNASSFILPPPPASGSTVIAPPPSNGGSRVRGHQQQAPATATSSFFGAPAPAATASPSLAGFGQAPPPQQNFAADPFGGGWGQPAAPAAAPQASKDAFDWTKF